MASKNTLRRYLDARGRGAIPALRALVKKKTRRELRLATLCDIANGKVTARVETARLLHRATNGEIDASELLGLTRPSEAA